MIDYSMVAACLVTRGDVDLTPIIAALPYDEIVVWDNREREDLGIYGRYAAIAETNAPIIYVQDDDLIVRCHDQLLAAYEPGRILCNYPAPFDIPWVARGALFDRALPEKAFQQWDRMFPRDRDFTHYWCDGVFALLSDCKMVDYGSEDLPYCNDPGRVSTSGDWYDDKRPQIHERVTAVMA